MTPFGFFRDFPSCDAAKVFCVHIDPEIAAPKELITALYYSLWFPGYFGFNWDALHDCLRDLEWIPYKKIVLIHRVVPSIPEKDLRIYLSILRDAALGLRDGKGRELEVFFKKEDQKAIECLLAG